MLRMMIESTDELTRIDGVPVRRCKGVTEAGIECEVFVHRIAANKRQDLAEFDRELQEQLPPGRHVPLSAILKARPSVKITIEEIDELTSIVGVPVCHWKGVTESGDKCSVFVFRVSSAKGANVEDECRFLLPNSRYVPLIELL